MPELPEVQTVVDTLQGFILNKEITDVKIKQERLIAQSKPEDFKEILIGSKIEEVRRRGKYIIIELDNRYYLVTHLRMTGRFVYTKQDEEHDKYDYIFFKFRGADELRLGSKRQFTRVYLVKDLEDAGSLTKLGPEPLSDEFTLELFKEMLSTRRGRIKPLLLNQKFLAGLGNIYVDEAIYISQIHPLRTADTLSLEEIERLYKAIKQVLREGIKHRGTTKWDYVDASGQAGEYQNYLRAYGREGEECNRCGSELDRIKVGGRSSYFCPSCQQEE
ncbi:formamidopyrimidine-DNA glycosylase Fpg [Halobacteroides halobius DSM 5150]|uniref:Formamidopyrimidine-DNA glycosylase n=1 Tax=Halobacteroides halobius (strain ATCC 35273 / DSM 5150 / MD-1) TaxID=748449 RepID=L0K7U6_HALHC|nr:DNA-formamidopyrimidine glycosylase [Halobacteroides halobius]AGB40424.1 formamidopyrimidine-DNA glycosylase Fpg [Halobacteroides halobius DSM 5150]